MLQVHGLDVSYGNLQVLFDVGFEVRSGETLALLGTNGAGKSTLLRAISGLILPDRGVVRLQGRTITLVDPELRSQLGMVQIPGGEALFGSLTVRENLEVFGWQLDRDVARPASGSRSSSRPSRSYATASTTRAGSLSGGQQQMLALAKAVMLDRSCC